MISERVEGLAQRSTGGQYVIDNQNARGGGKGRSVTELPSGLAICRTFGIRGLYAKLACYLECQDHTAGRRSNDDVDFLIVEAVGDEATSLRGCSRLAQKVELFDVLVAMAT